MAMNPYGQDEMEYYPDLVRQQTINQLNPQAVEDLYQKHLGRGSDPGGLAAHLKNPYGLSGVESAITGSDEFKQRQAAPTTATDAGTPTTGTGTTTTGTGTPAGTQTGWGYDNPTGGRKEFSYTPQDYGSDYSRLEGFRDMGTLGNDPNAAGSIKYIFAKSAAGVPLDANFVATVVQRLNEQGIPAKQAGPDSIDFGNGEGPIDVVRGGTPETGYHGVQWLPGSGAGTAGQTAPPAIGGQTGGPPVSNTMPVPIEQDTNSRIMQLIQELMQGGNVRESIMGQLKG